MTEAELPRLDVDSAAFRADPHAVLRSIREQARIVASRRGFEVLDHADVQALLTDDRLLTQNAEVYRRYGAQPMLVAFAEDGLLAAMHGAKHDRIRRVFLAAFRARNVEASRPVMRAIAEQLVDALPADGTVVDFVLARRNIPRVNLIGWSWGTTLMATYTTQNNAKVERLVLYAPSWIRTTPSLVQTGPGPTPAYRTVSRDAALGRWLNGVPEDKKQSLIPAGWFDQWADATWATDPEGAKMNPSVLRAPNGVVQDGLDFFGAGKAYYDPGKITVPTLLIHAEWDQDTPPYMAQTLFPLLKNSPGKRYVALAEGTHTIVMEKNRMKLFEAVQSFLDEAGGS